MYRILKLGVLFILIACRTSNEVQYSQFIKKCYSFYSEDMQMDIQFEIKNDTVFIFYAQALDNGNYLNAYEDTTDYAGFFALKKIVDSTVTVQIINYLDKDDTYDVSLKFTDRGETLVWNIDSLNLIAYLPKDLVLQSCKK